MRGASENSAPEQGSFGALSVVAIVKNPRGMNAALSYLHSHYNLVVISTVPQLIQSLQTHRPKVVLLSWNLKNIDVKRLHRMLVDLFKIKCIVVAEDSQKTTTASLMTSGINQFLLAPVSGPSVHSRIQSLFKEEFRDKPKIFLNDSPPVKIKKEEIPNTLRWEETVDAQDSAKSMWKAEHDDGDLGGTYIFKGKKRPQYNEIKKEWNIKENEGSVFFKKGKTENFGTVKRDETIDQISDQEFKSRIRRLQDELSDGQELSANTGQIAIETGGKINDSMGEVTIEAEGKTVDSALAKAVKATFVKTFERNTAPITKDMGISKITLCSVSCSQYSGYVICASSQDEFHTPYMEKMTAVLQTELKGLGQIILAPLRIFEVEIPPTEFINWVREKADFHVMSNLTEIALAFFSAPELPVIDPKTESFGVSVIKDLVPEKNLDFDLYLHMPKNQKFLHYLKKGQNYPKTLYNKFVSQAFETLYVKKEQQEDFFRYLAKNFINKSLKD